MDGKIIAEIGSVHDGSFGNACKLIELIAQCGADVVKFQTHIAEAETLPDAPSPPYFSDEPRMEYFRRTGFSLAQWRSLRDVCKTYQVEFLSSPFSQEAVDLLEEIGVSAYKIPSGEVTNLPLLEYIAQTGRPVFLSSGMSNWAELDQAIAALAPGGPVTVLQCTSAYPCPPERVGLNLIAEMRIRWGIDVGFSDHTKDAAAAFAAAALGACVIEKHITFSRHMYGSDAANAMEPKDFANFCRGLRAIWIMSANPVDKDDLSPYRAMKQIFEKSIATATALPKGHILGKQDLAFKKPGDGISAAQWKSVIGKRIAVDLGPDHKLSPVDFTTE